MKEYVLRCFNKGAENYDSAAIVQSQVAKSLAKRIPKTKLNSVLEIGCGTGLFSQEIISSFPNATILLTDLSPAMVDVCKRRFKNLPNVTTLNMDGELIKEVDSSFDLISSSMAVHWFAEIKNSFNQIIKKLAPGGQFIFSMLGKNSLQEWRDICVEHRYPVSTPSFLSVQTLAQYFPHMKIVTEKITQSYKNLHDFLRALKAIGAVATSNDYPKLSAGKLRQLIRQYNSEIHITYEVIYGSYKKG